MGTQKGLLTRKCQLSGTQAVTGSVPEWAPKEEGERAVGGAGENQNAACRFCLEEA